MYFYKTVLAFILSVKYADSNIQWLRRARSERDSKFGSDSFVTINIDGSRTEVCPHDHIKMTWNSDYSPTEFSFVIEMIDRTDIILGKIVNFATFEKTKLLNSTTSCKIDCLVNENHCEPLISQVTLSENEPMISVIFQTDTSQPSFHSKNKLLSCFDMEPLINGYARGNWKNPKELNIIIEKDDYENLLKLQEKQSFKITLKNNEMRQLYYEGSDNLRFLEHGDISLFAINNTNNKVISSIIHISVTLCNHSFIPSLLNLNDNSIMEQHLSMPLIKYSGLISVDGAMSIKIPSHTLITMVGSCIVLSYILQII